MCFFPRAKRAVYVKLVEKNVFWEFVFRRPIHKQLSSSVSKFYSKLKVLRYRRSGGRTELSDHQNTGNFGRIRIRWSRGLVWFLLKSQNIVVFFRARNAPLTFVLKSKKNWIFPRAKRAVYVKLVDKHVSGNCF